eukprot:62540_1
MSKKYYQNANMNANMKIKQDKCSFYRNLLDSLHDYVLHQRDYLNHPTYQNIWRTQRFNINRNYITFTESERYVIYENKDNSEHKTQFQQNINNSVQKPLLHQQSQSQSHRELKIFYDRSQRFNLNRNWDESSHVRKQPTGEHNSNNDNKEMKRRDGADNEKPGDNPEDEKGDDGKARRGFNDRERDEKEDDKSDSSEEEKKDNYENSKAKTVQCDYLFLDGLYDYMLARKVPESDVRRLHFKLETEEEFDTDSLKDIFAGIEIDFPFHNILPTRHHSVMVDYVKYANLECFNGGYRFYYWKYYKRRTDSVYEDLLYDANDSFIHIPHTLYVRATFPDLKQEMLHNSIYPLDMVQYDLAIEKLNHVVWKCERRKLIKSKSSPLLRYDIDDNTDITKQHLLCIILYCDYDILCTEFSKTFRRKNIVESIKQTKKRNREFANFARILRETVELYGSTGSTLQNVNIVQENKCEENCNTIDGPFFSGMSPVMVLEEFNIKLCSPTSTTSNFNVAYAAANDNGIIVQMNNNGYMNAHRLRAFDCAWISKVPSEREKLFCGGLHPIKIEAVQKVGLLKTMDYCLFSKTLFYFQCMFHGTIMNDHAPPCITEHDKETLHSLIEYRLKGDTFNNGLDRYIKLCFDAFVFRQTQIVLNLPQLHEYFRDFITQQYQNVYVIEEKENKESIRDDVEFKQKDAQIPENEVKLWLTNIVKLPAYYSLFEEDGWVELDDVKTLTDDKLKEIGIKKGGHRNKILRKINELNKSNVSANDNADPQQKHHGHDEVSIKLMDDILNHVLPIVYTLFPNLKFIIIDLRHNKTSYSIDLVSLLLLINCLSTECNIKVIVKKSSWTKNKGVDFNSIYSTAERCQLNVNYNQEKDYFSIINKS